MPSNPLREAATLLLKWHDDDFDYLPMTVPDMWEALRAALAALPPSAATGEPSPAPPSEIETARLIERCEAAAMAVPPTYASYQVAALQRGEGINGEPYVADIPAIVRAVLRAARTPRTEAAGEARDG